MGRFLKRTYRLPARVEESFTAWLWQAGTTGLEWRQGEEGLLLVEAWFDPDSPAFPPPPGVRLLAEEEIASDDWMADYRRRVQPLVVGERFFLDPREPSDALPDVPAGRWLLRLPARTAFGTGSHETTRLMLEEMETLDWGQCRVLDVGSGTGILTFAALLLGARWAAGFDLDPAAPLGALENGRLNRAVLAPFPSPPRFFAGEAAALAPEIHFDRILVNVIPQRVDGALPDLVRRLAPAGELLFSGILKSERAAVLRRVGGLGLELAEGGERRDGEWVALRLRHRESPMEGTP